MARRRGSWVGGRIRYDKRGRPTYEIRRQVDGERIIVSTRCHDERTALLHLSRFEADPRAYTPAGVAAPAALLLDDDLAKAYLDWSRDEAGNTRQWRGKQRKLLAWWADQLNGLDLRAGGPHSVSLKDHIVPALKGTTSRHHRISVIKGLYTWLRTVEHRISTAEDPVFGQLSVPQAKPAQLQRSKVIPRDHVLLVIEHLGRPWRDALEVQAGTGWHTTELLRFAAEGSIEPVPRHAHQEGVAGVLVCPLHKAGDPHRTRVSQSVLEAAKRLRAHGSISREWYDRAVRSACVAVKRPDGGKGIPVFTPGRLRHSTATWAIDGGADPAQVAAFLGHRSPRTTKKFYATHASAAKVPTLL